MSFFSFWQIAIANSNACWLVIFAFRCLGDCRCDSQIIIDTQPHCRYKNSPIGQFFGKFFCDQLSTFLLVRRKWLAVVASVKKILPNVGCQLAERVAKLIEARIGHDQISLRVEIVPL